MADLMLDRVVDRFSQTTASATNAGRWPAFWEATSRWLYRYINRKLVNASEVRFLNYGYAGPDQPDLERADEPDRIYIQLYHRVIGAADLAGRDVLEVSCGRGGGAGYVSRYFRPRHYCGLDRSAGAVEFCKRQHGSRALRFICGDAQHLPFSANAFDAVINVEASHDYRDLPAFLGEVRRVLRPGGRFFYTDFRKRPDCSAWRGVLERCGLDIECEEDITAGVVKGLELNSEHNRSLVHRLSPRLLRSAFLQFAGVQGSYVHRSFAQGKMAYMRYVLVR